MKDIKTKEVRQDINVLDKRGSMNHYVKKDCVKRKEHSEPEETKVSDPSKSAINIVIKQEKRTTANSIYQAKHYSKKIKQKHQDTKQSDVKTEIKEKEPDIKQKEHHKLIEEKSDQKDVTNVKQHMKDRHLNKREANLPPNPVDNRIKSKSLNKKKSSVPFRNVHKGDYHSRMRFQAIQKYKEKVKHMKESSSIVGKGIRGTEKGAMFTMKMIIKSVASVKHLISLGSALILLVVITLFFGVFAALGDDNNTNTALQNVSAEVNAYTEVIQKYAKDYEIEDYVPLIKAVMMQESAGNGKDPMQASECAFNEKYPRKPNGITNAEYSIKVGVQNLADCMKKAKVENTTDIKTISLALQGYNYGQAYISWAVDNFGGYTHANAKVYSDEMKAKLKTDIYGDPQYVEHVLQYYHLGNGNLVEIAQSQVGNIGGRPYWSWYGYKDRVEWCACFVSWCANEAGLIDKGTVPKFSYCPSGIQWFKEHNQWQARGTIPQPGYIIFFDWEQDGISDHVGIVVKVEKGIVYTIEGNSLNDECRSNTYTINEIVITGYGVTN